MASGGYNLNQQPYSPATNLVEQKLRAEGIVKAGASWFIWVSGLSLVNSVLSLTGTGFRFIFGLGIAQVVDGLAHQAGRPGAVLDLIINGFVSGIFVLFWNFARKGQQWAFVVGMVLYALDGLILILFKDFLGVAFHAYVLFRIYAGLRSVSVLQDLQRVLAPAGAAIEPH
jgi:hypothetical protein